MRSLDGTSKLFVAGIGDNRKTDLDRVFSKYGEILSIYVDDKKGFAFVEFTSPDDAQQALEHIHQMKVNGSRLRVEYAKSEKGPREHRRSSSRERSGSSNHYNQLQVTANRMPALPAYRQNYYQPPHPSMLMNNAAMSRGRSLTPPSFKQNARTSSMRHRHLRPDEFYSAYPPNLYMDPAYYRPFDDPYAMQRLQSFPSSMLPSSSAHPYGHLYASADFDRRPPGAFHRRSRSPTRRRTPPARRERQPKRRMSPSPRDRSPRIPSATHRSRKRSRSHSITVVSTSEPKASSPSSTEDEAEKQPDFRSSQETYSNQNHVKRRRRE